MACKKVCSQKQGLRRHSRQYLSDKASLAASAAKPAYKPRTCHINSCRKKFTCLQAPQHRTTAHHGWPKGSKEAAKAALACRSSSTHTTSGWCTSSFTRASTSSSVMFCRD